MSGIDDIFDEEPPQYDTVADERAARSKADDIIDAVEGIIRRPTEHLCPYCGSDNVVIRGDRLCGGTMTRKCRDCRKEIPFATVQSAVVQKGPTTAQPGPFYGPPRPRLNTNQPPNRVALEAHEAKKNR